MEEGLREGRLSASFNSRLKQIWYSWSLGRARQTAETVSVAMFHAARDVTYCAKALRDRFTIINRISINYLHLSYLSYSA